MPIQYAVIEPKQVTPTPTKAIVADGVEMIFPSRSAGDFLALQDISLDLLNGDIELLMGPSGSGKTTLLSILSGILTPTAGSVHLFGQEITHLSPTQLTRFRLENIGLIFQDSNLFPALTAMENILVVLNLKGIRGRKARLQAQELLNHVGLAQKAESLPRDLSGGQQQRVGIARALAGKPRLVMADEPTASLDSHSGHTVIKILRTLAKEEGCSVLIVTHDSRIVDVADRVVHLEDGMIQSHDPVLPV